MSAICLYFQVHQPNRLKMYSVFDLYQQHDYFDHKTNQAILQRVAEKCYLPTNEILYQLIKRYHGDFNIAFSISGSLIEQLKSTSPKTLDSFKQLANTGCVELLNETYYHSLSFLFNEKEFIEQVKLHDQLIQQEFQQSAKTFRNTECIYNNELAHCVRQLGYDTILAEGSKKLLGKQSPNHIYQNNNKNINLLLRNYQLSDDIAFRFSQKNAHGDSLTAERYANWLYQHSEPGQVINLFMDYETFGEHHWADSGIFQFLENLPGLILRQKKFTFLTPQQLINTKKPIASLNAAQTTSWADSERDLSAWLGNDLQKDAINSLYSIKPNTPTQLQTWRHLQTSDHFYYLSDKQHNDGNVHQYFNPYPSALDAYTNYMTVLADLSDTRKLF